MDYVCFLTVAIILGLITGLIADRKGHSFFGWLFLGAFFALLFLPWAIVMAPNERELERRQVRAHRARWCPYCRELVRIEAFVCRHCGRDLPSIPEPPSGENPFYRLWDLLSSDRFLWAVAITSVISAIASLVFIALEWLGS